MSFCGKARNIPVFYEGDGSRTQTGFCFFKGKALSAMIFLETTRQDVPKKQTHKFNKNVMANHKNPYKSVIVCRNRAVLQINCFQPFFLGFLGFGATAAIMA